MALKSEDLSSGFRHGKVMAFINERMSRHAKGPEFYLENVSLSWEKVEDKLRAILEDRLVPSQAKEACAWSSLALGVRFAYKQSQLHRHRVQWLHDFAGLHRSAAQALASDLTLLAAQHEVERKEAAFRLQLTQATLAE
ncbi:PREDICTED: testis-expressed sequence 13A protein-like, partial [Bison bison bison]